MSTDAELQASSAWGELLGHKKEFESQRISALFSKNTKRFDEMTCKAAGITLDYSKNMISSTTMAMLVRLAQEHNLGSRINSMMKGEVVNSTERRQALHTALRTTQAEEHDYKSDVSQALDKMTHFVEAVHEGSRCGYYGDRITDVVNIGIGGSDLGPQMVTEALKPFQLKGIQCHFVSNVDASDICDTLNCINPKTTLFIIASKTFTTTETLANAVTARNWLLKGLSEDMKAVQAHFVAVTANVDNAVSFGIDKDNIFPMWDWVGGRFSLWSSIGLPIALAVGMERFNELRAGAAEMDDHFQSAPLEKNLPVILGLLGIWYINFWDAHSHAVLPYDHLLRSFTRYLQQLDMESNGKSASSSGGYVDYHVGSVIWGDVGTNGQHSFHQLLHQGTRFIPTDFIVCLKSHNPVGDHHALLFANCLSQSRALMVGKSQEQAKSEFIAMGYSIKEAEALSPHKAMVGNRPSNTLILDELTPQSLGALIALYEHKVYVQSVIWEVNAFDQWGVELGKKLSKEIFCELSKPQRSSDFDSSTEGLMELYMAKTLLG
jgi:glucose-6-phosphate isomerase